MPAILVLEIQSMNGSEVHEMTQVDREPKIGTSSMERSEQEPEDTPLPAGPDASLSPRQLRGVDLLLAGRRITDVAEELGIRRQTLWKWQKNQDFQREVVRRRDELFSDICGSLVAGVQEAVETLRGCMGAETMTGAARDEKQRLRAAVAMLGLAPKGEVFSRLLDSQGDWASEG